MHSKCFLLSKYMFGRKVAVSYTHLRLHLKLLFLSEVEVSGIPGVAVKCVEIRRNISGEGGLLGLY